MRSTMLSAKQTAKEGYLHTAEIKSGFDVVNQRAEDRSSSEGFVNDTRYSIRLPGAHLNSTSDPELATPQDLTMMCGSRPRRKKSLQKSFRRIRCTDTATCCCMMCVKSPASGEAPGMGG